MARSQQSLYVYKVVADTGGAPCVWERVLSLALCKPKIRRAAREGDMVFGFGGKDYGERLIYIAEVTGKRELASTIETRVLLNGVIASMRTKMESQKGNGRHVTIFSRMSEKGM